MKIEVQLEEADVRVTVVAQSLSFDSNAWMTASPDVRERLREAIHKAVQTWLRYDVVTTAQPEKPKTDFEVAPV